MSAPLHPKNIVVCLDGTSNELDHHPTNAAKVFMMLDLDDPTAQIAYYDPGVGTLPSATARGSIERALSRLGGLAFGFGMRGKVSRAYSWLVEHYAPGDRIYIFGFSRGAYTARALAALLARPGLLRAGSEHLVDYAVAQYVKPAGTRKSKQQRAHEAQAFADALCWGTDGEPISGATGGFAASVPDELKADVHAVPIEYLGLWDTVEAWFAGLGSLDWPDTASLWNVARLRHAVSIDEARRPFRYLPVDRCRGFEEAWFPGVHCDVGGTFENHELATIALKWVFDGVCDKLALRDQQPAEVYRRYCAVDRGFATHAPTHTNSWAWNLLLPARRRIPDDAVLHESVRERRTASPAYLPGLARTDDPGRWTDGEWWMPRLAPPVPHLPSVAAA
ncbi:phospholipase effector Tle1 domain-containing protein [Microbacterium sp.]|uniref:phospholipase effector Tle1 domain-containing protein n=1 Tax=Microbacterium sp. TaxID=51671 RepID=UPI003A95DA2B